MQNTWPFSRRAQSKSTLTMCVLLAAVLSFAPGCDDAGQSEAQLAQQQADALSRKLDSERQAHQRKLDLAATEMEQIREDAQAVNTILVSCAVAIVLLVLLLARERRCRRVVERLLRMLLDRIHGPRISP